MKTRRGNYPSPVDELRRAVLSCGFSRKRKLHDEHDSQRVQQQLTQQHERPSKSCRTSACCARKKRAPPSPSPSPSPSSSSSSSSCCLFDLLPDDLLVNVAIALAQASSSPSDLVNMMLINRRFLAAATHSQVFANVAPAAFGLRAEAWSSSMHAFLKKCADAGNIDASYTLGMIRFYCLGNYSGASLMAKAAMASHAAALHSLAVIQFNGSGGMRKDKDLKAGVALCARAAALGHVDAIRELGHCLQDGYGVCKNASEGRRLLLEANAREAAAAVAASPRSFLELVFKRGRRRHGPNGAVKPAGGAAGGLNGAARVDGSFAASGGVCEQACPHHRFFSLPTAIKADIFHTYSGCGSGAIFRLLQSGGCALLSDFGCNVPAAKVHIANRFLVDWFARSPPVAGLRLCSHINCGRPETRKHEFRRCSACGTANYCSRACQALDWKLKHKYDCMPAHEWEEREEEEAEVEAEMEAGGAAGAAEMGNEEVEEDAVAGAAIAAAAGETEDS